MPFVTAALLGLALTAPAPSLDPVLRDPWSLAGAPSVVAATAEPVTIDWRTLGGLNPNTGVIAPHLKALNGQVVRIAGYVVPLDDATQEDAEFLLVPYYGACIHTPPPPPNQMVLVEMNSRQKVRLDLFEAVWLEGTLRIDLVESLYGTAGFQIKGLKVSPYMKR